jgi:hypothetical protein
MASTESRPAASVAGSPQADKYLARRAIWEWHNNGQIDVLNADRTVAATLTEWQTAIFHAADGNTSVQEFVSAMADSYDRSSTDIPADLGQRLLGDVAYLVDDVRAVEMWDKKGDLAEEFQFAQSEYPVE